MVQIKEQFKTMFDQDLGKFMAVRDAYLSSGGGGGGGGLDWVVKIQMITH